MTNISHTTLLDVNQIMEYIPHRYPFLLIDRTVEIAKDDYCICLKCVTINEHHFQGHFPSQPVMPGVLIVEAIAQTSAILVVETLGDDAKGKLVYFMSIDNCKFRKPVVPGDVLHLHVSKIKQRGSIWKFQGYGYVDGDLVAEAIVTAMIRD